MSAKQSADKCFPRAYGRAPLIMVLQFVGFIAGWQNPGELPSPARSNTGCSDDYVVDLLPCFLFILVLAPLVDRVRHLQALDAALSTITAAVVGVILNLAVWFGQHVLFPLGRPDIYAIVLAILFPRALARQMGGHPDSLRWRSAWPRRQIVTWDLTL